MRRYILFAALVLVIVVSFFVFNKKEPFEELNGDYWKGIWFSEKTKAKGAWYVGSQKRESIKAYECDS